MLRNCYSDLLSGILDGNTVWSIDFCAAEGGSLWLELEGFVLRIKG